jgi:hypothetical protein
MDISSILDSVKAVVVYILLLTTLLIVANLEYFWAMITSARIGMISDRRSFVASYLNAILWE